MHILIFITALFIIPRNELNPIVHWQRMNKENMVCVQWNIIQPQHEREPEVSGKMDRTRDHYVSYAQQGKHYVFFICGVKNSLHELTMITTS